MRKDCFLLFYHPRENLSTSSSVICSSPPLVLQIVIFIFPSFDTSSDYYWCNTRSSVACWYCLHFLHSSSHLCYCTDITPLLLARVVSTVCTPTVMPGETERNIYLPRHDRRPQRVTQSLSVFSITNVYRLFTYPLFQFPTPSLCSSELGRAMT